MYDTLRDYADKAGFVVGRFGDMSVAAQSSSDLNEPLKKFAHLIIEKCLESLPNDSNAAFDIQDFFGVE